MVPQGSETAEIVKQEDGQQPTDLSEEASGNLTEIFVGHDGCGELLQKPEVTNCNHSLHFSPEGTKASDSTQLSEVATPEEAATKDPLEASKPEIPQNELLPYCLEEGELKDDESSDPVAEVYAFLRIFK